MRRNPSEPAPARIHLLPAKEAPYVVVIRRKPSRLVHIMRWNTQTDEIEHGSWFNGRIYEMRCDVSFDGEYMIYLAMGSRGETWTGICRLPFLRTEVDWPNTGSWHGGGLFRSAAELELNAGYAATDAQKAIQTGRRLPFRIGELANDGYGEDEGVLYPRFERDGFRRNGPMGKERSVRSTHYAIVCDDDPGWSVRPSPQHPELRVRYRGYFGGRGRVFEWDLPDKPGFLDENVSWAAYDCLAQLVVARLGVLYRYSLESLFSQTPSAVFDLESLERPVREEREEDDGDASPPIQMAHGNLQDIDARALILPFCDAAWVREIRDIAGSYLIADLQDWSPESGEVLRTPAYYLRQHDLIHVAEPEPSWGVDALRATCRSAFAGVSRGSDVSVALKPIGVEAGWPYDQALAATMEAATSYVEAELGRRVVIVEDRSQR